MAIDLFCYSTLDAEEFNACFKKIMQDYPKIFPHNYIISTISKASEIGTEIALEYGMSNVHSFCIITLNNKKLTINTAALATILRTYIDSEKILILYENEKPI